MTVYYYDEEEDEEDEDEIDLTEYKSRGELRELFKDLGLKKMPDEEIEEILREREEQEEEMEMRRESLRQYAADRRAEHAAILATGGTVEGDALQRSLMEEQQEQLLKQEEQNGNHAPFQSEESDNDGNDEREEEASGELAHEEL